MTNGTLSRHGDSWVARPGKVGTEAVVTVTANIDGRPQTVATTSFRVRKLPDPAPFISYTDSKGHQERYKGSKPFPKTLLLQAPGIEAAIDDDLLNVSYRVLSFETVFSIQWAMQYQKCHKVPNSRSARKTHSVACNEGKDSTSRV